MNRILNKFFALVLFILLIPFFFIIILYLKLTIGKPIIFKQQRSGMHGKTFTLYKFRTMKNNYQKKIDEKKRIISYLYFFRKLRLDELPQILNILKGDLFFVGPRPLLPEYNKLYNSQQKKRLNVMPGITGWAQVNGDNNLSWKKKFKLDIWYVENKSFLLDLYILVKTIIFFFTKIISKNDKKLVKKFNGKN